MFGLRSARGRAVLASAVLISVLVAVSIVVVLRVREHQHRLLAMEDTATTAATLEDARGQLFLELASISGLVFTDDPTLADEYREAAARLEQDLIQVRAEAAAAGKADYVATLDDLTERAYNFHQAANAAIPILLQGNPETLAPLVAAVMPDTRTEVEAMVATLDQLAESQQAELTAERTTASQVTDDTSWIVIGFGGAALLVAAAIVIATIVSLVRPMASLRASARAITSGNLEARAKVFGPEEAASVARDFNEMAETLLAKTKEYIDTTNLTGDMIARLDRHGRWVFLNDGACQFFGKPREELLGTDGLPLVHPEDLERVVQMVQERIERKEPIKGFVHRLFTPMGTRTVEWNACPLFDEVDHYVGLQITGRDVTDRERAEKALRESEERLRTLVTNVPVILFAIDREGRLTLAEGKALEGFGVQPADVVGRTVLEVHGGSPEVSEYIQRAFAGESFTATLEFAGFVFETHHTPMRDQNGEVTGIIGVAVDITERKKMEDALAARTKEYIDTTNLTDEIIAKVDERGKWAFVNDAACRFFGKTREELLGTYPTDLVHPEDVEATVQLVQDGRTRREPVRGFVNRQLTPRGTRVVEWNGCSLFDENGRYAGLQISGRDITERKQMEDALRAKTEEYIATTNLTGDIIAKLDKRGNWAFLNDAACEFFGKPREELLGADSRAFLHPEDVEPTAQAIRGMRATKEPVRAFVNRQITPLGTRAVEWNGFPIFDGHGQYVGIQITGRDITERRQMEEALAAKTEEYIATTNLTGDIIAKLDKRGNWVFLNDAACQFFGKPREELLGTDSRVFVHPEDLEATAQSIRDTRAGKALSTGFFNRQLTPRGTRIVEWNGYPLFNEEGQYAGIQITGREITERRRMEEALRESEARYRLLTENTSDLIWTMDLGLRYTYMSPAITRMRGYTAEEIMDAPITETMTPASVEVARKTFAERVALERAGKLGPHDATKVELEMYCKDGSTIWTEMNMVWLRNSEGKPIGILGVTRDISERKKAEAERERLNAELEMRAITDSLTGLYDHAHFYQRLAEEIDRSKRYKHGFAVVMMDVDDFKRFNDSRGHQVGDEMLRLVADCIRAGLRSSDIAFRYGGDEFAAILPHADSSKAKAAVSRINGHIAKNLKQIDGGAATRLSLSAGVACFPEDGTTADVLVRIADAALYSAKWVARARDIMGQREDIQSLISALVSRRGGVEGPADGTIFRPEALHEQQARIVASVASSIAVALKDAGVTQALEDPDLQVLATVGAAAEIKDRYIRGHPERTSGVAAALAEEMRLSSEQVRNIKIAGLLHDIGKITVSESILNKAGRLTKREFANIKDHPIVGATLVSQVKGFEQLIPIVRHHHERFDGKGYPDGLTGDEIPLEARIMSVVDVFDALTHERSYREALSNEEATAELERGAGTQFDPVVLEAFLVLVKTRGDELTAFSQAASENGQPAAARAAGRGKR